MLILFDQYEELKRPINLFDANNCEEWGDDAKVIISTSTDYLKAFKNYEVQFAPNKKLTSLIEYKINDLNPNQVQQYIQ